MIYSWCVDSDEIEHLESHQPLNALGSLPLQEGSLSVAVDRRTSFFSIAFQRRAKKILPSQLERAIGLKLAGLSVGPDLWKSRIAAHTQDGGTEHDFQTRCLMVKSGAWRHEQRFHTQVC